MSCATDTPVQPQSPEAPSAPAAVSTRDRVLSASSRGDWDDVSAALSQPDDTVSSVSLLRCVADRRDAGTLSRVLLSRAPPRRVRATTPCNARASTVAADGASTDPSVGTIDGTLAVTASPPRARVTPPLSPVGAATSTRQLHTSAHCDSRTPESATSDPSEEGNGQVTSPQSATPPGNRFTPRRWPFRRSSTPNTPSPSSPATPSTSAAGATNSPPKQYARPSSPPSSPRQLARDSPASTSRAATTASPSQSPKQSSGAPYYPSTPASPRSAAPSPSWTPTPKPPPRAFSARTFTLVGFDLETGGFNAKQHAILSMGLCARGGAPSTTLVHPGIMAVEAEALKVNGLSLATLKEKGQPYTTALAWMHEYLCTASLSAPSSAEASPSTSRHPNWDEHAVVLVAHNAPFDVRFLLATLERGEKQRRLFESANIWYVDTLELVGLYKSGDHPHSRKLGAILESLQEKGATGFPTGAAHEAGYDAAAALFVFEHYWGEAAEEVVRKHALPLFPVR